MTPPAYQTSKYSLSRTGWAAIAIAIIPFVAKRVIVLGQHDYIFWLSADYSARVLSLIGVVIARRSGLFNSAPVSAGLLFSTIIFVLLLAAEINLHVYIYPILHPNLDYFRIWHYPTITNPTIQSFDFAFGLLLVAVSEESVFRWLLIALFERWQMKATMAVLLSSAAFAAVHFTSGLADTINAFLHGLLLGAAYCTTRRLSVCIVAHYLFDLYVVD